MGFGVKNFLDLLMREKERGVGKGGFELLRSALGFVWISRWRSGLLCIESMARGDYFLLPLT